MRSTFDLRTALLRAPRPSGGRAERLARAGDYLALTRPAVLALVLFTAPPAMVLGHGGWPGAGALLGVILGAALVGAGCSALNAWYERDLDARMARTHQRPLPAGRLEARQALAFGLALSAAGLLVLERTGGWLPAALGAATLAHYMLVYTIWLKPRTPSSVVVGGVAGAAAPLIADAAVDGRLGPWGLALFAIVLVWQPPHVWSIHLYRRSEYAAAGFPILPETAGPAATRRRMLFWALALIPVALLPWLSGDLRVAYPVVAVAGGALFAGRIVRAMRRASDGADRAVFTTSLSYLAILFATMLLDLILQRA
jgi:protoheme IX farnesyltransferase